MLYFLSKCIGFPLLTEHLAAKPHAFLPQSLHFLDHLPLFFPDMQGYQLLLLLQAQDIVLNAYRAGVAVGISRRKEERFLLPVRRHCLNI